MSRENTLDQKQLRRDERDLRKGEGTKPPVRTPPRPWPIKLAEKLAKLTLKQVGRRRAKFARRASTAKHLLAKLLEGGRTASQVILVQDMNLAAFKQANAELEARRLHAQDQIK